MFHDSDSSDSDTDGDWDMGDEPPSLGGASRSSATQRKPVPPCKECGAKEDELCRGLFRSEEARFCDKFDYYASNWEKTQGTHETVCCEVCLERKPSWMTFLTEVNGETWAARPKLLEKYRGMKLCERCIKIPSGVSANPIL